MLAIIWNMLQRPLISLLKKKLKMFENNWISNTDRAKQLDSQLDERFTNSWAHFLPSFGIQRTTNVCFSQAFLSGSSVVKDSTEKNPLIPSWSITRIKALNEGIKKWNLLPLQSSWPWEILTECYVVNLFKMVLMWRFSVFKCVKPKIIRKTNTISFI